MPPTFDQRFRATSDWAAREGVKAAYPTCWSANYQDWRGEVNGVVMLPEGAVDWKDVAAWELGNIDPNNFGLRVSRTHEYAKKHGYLHGFPNFHHADYGQGTVYGTFLIKQGVPSNPPLTEWRWVTGPELQLDAKAPVDEWFRRAHAYAIKPGFYGAYAGAMPTGHYVSVGPAGAFKIFTLLMLRAAPIATQTQSRDLGFLNPPGKRDMTMSDDGLANIDAELKPGAPYRIGIWLPTENPGEDVVVAEIRHGSEHDPPVKPQHTVVSLENATGWPKEVRGWADQAPHPLGKKATGPVDPGKTAEVTLARPHLWGQGLGTADTLVFSKPKFLGQWQDMYHWDPDQFWKVFGGRWVHVRWKED